MANLGEYLTATLIQAGIPNDDPTLVDLQKKTGLIEIPDPLLAKINEVYLTQESAKNNQALKTHFFATTLKGVDAELAKTMDLAGLSDEKKAEILAEKNTFQRIPLLYKAIEETSASKYKVNDNGELLKRQIVDLNNAIAQEKQAKEDALKAERETYNAKLSDLVLNQHLSSKKWVDHVKDENFLLAKHKIINEAKAKGVNLVFDDKANTFKLTTEAGDYFENNKKVDFNNFVDKIAADNKWIVVSEPPKPTPAKQTPSNGTGLNVSKFAAAANAAKENIGTETI